MTAFVTENKNRFGVEPICRVLRAHGVKIAPSSYYAAAKRAPSARAVRDEQVMTEIKAVWEDPERGRRVYGARKVHAQLRRQHGVAGQDVGRRKVERLMRCAGLQGAVRGKQFKTTRADAGAVRPPDLVKRDFTATAPNLLWLVDFTYVPTWSGMAFTAFVQDAFSRRIVGWRTASSMPTSLPLDALEMALWTRERAGQETAGVIHHSDAGSQYTSIRYSERLLDAGALASIGTVGDSYDNAQAETIIGQYKTEMVALEGPWRGAGDLELATFDWVHWHNENRLHGALGYLTPVEYEEEHYRQNQAQQQTFLGEPTLY